MRSDRERELWLLKVTDEYVGKGEGPKRPAAPGNMVKWGAIAVAGMTTVSLVYST